MATKFYKTNAPKVVSAWTSYLDSKSELRNKSNIFAEKYGALPVILGSVNETFFSGLVFEDFESMPDKACWTKPIKRNHYASVPRRSIRDKEFKTRLIEIQDEFNANKPSKVTPIAFYDSIGISWGDLLFSGFTSFFYDGFLYCCTSMSMGEMAEIFGSEYDEAEKAFRAENKASK